MASVAKAGLSGRRDTVSIGSLFARTFGLIGAAPVVVLSLSLLLSGLLKVAMSWGIASLARFGLTSGAAMLAVVSWSGSSVISIALSVLVQGAITRAALAVADGRRIGIGESLIGALTVLPGLLVVALLSAAGVGFGLILLAVPGILLATIWSVSAPAIVAERLGPIAALRRSRWLTRGHRGTVFGMLALLLVLSWVASGVWQATVLVMFGFHGSGMFGGAALGSGPSIGWALANLAYETLAAAVWACAHVALYVELRDAREGPTQARLATIFA